LRAIFEMRTSIKYNTEWYGRYIQLQLQLQEYIRLMFDEIAIINAKF
jgi:hypothetical protein